MSELSELTLKFSLRENTGRNACRQMRASGRIPAILYGKELNKSLSVDDKEMLHAFETSLGNQLAYATDRGSRGR